MRMNLASEMRTETQTMARLACYIGAGFQAQAHRAKLIDAKARFQSDMAKLKDGDQAQGLSPETDPQILAALQAVATGWPRLAARLGLLANGGTLDPTGVAAIDQESLELLTRTDNLSNRIASVNGEALQNLPLIMTLSIDMAGRQVMRTEKAAKEACLIGSGIEVEANQAELAQTITVFSTALNALIEGYPGLVVRAPTPEIKALLEDTRKIWAAPKAALSRIATGEDISPEDRLVIGSGLELVAAKLHAVATLYRDIQSGE